MRLELEKMEVNGTGKGILESVGCRDDSWNSSSINSPPKDEAKGSMAGIELLLVKDKTFVVGMGPKLSLLSMIGDRKKKKKYPALIP